MQPASLGTRGMDSDDEEISAAHLQALFDVLTNFEVYEEIAALKHSYNIRRFGTPLQDDIDVTRTSSPMLKILLQAFVLTLPGLSNIDPAFWKQDIVELVVALDDSNLSESYDKGAVGIRRMLSTASAALAEAVARGVLGGIGVQGAATVPNDLLDAAKIEASWEYFVHESIYSDMIDQLAAKIAETPDLSQQSALVQAAHKYVLLMLSSFLHYILIVSPRGQPMLSLMIKAHELVPYYLIRQTLKIGNVASMLNAMLKIVLAKMSVSMSSVAGWFGYRSPSESGMNLLQYIISNILHNDLDILRNEATKIKEESNFGGDTCAALSAYCNLSQDQQQNLRLQTSENFTLIDRIFANAGLTTATDTHSLPYLEYLVTQLSIRDREKIVETLCQHDPDLLSSTVRRMVAAYEPIIRDFHKSVDLSAAVLDLQSFLTDLISLSKVQNGAEQLPTVEQFYKLLDKHAKSCHKFLHQAFRNNCQLKEQYSTYAKEAMTQYRQKVAQDRCAAGDMTNVLKTFYHDLQPLERLLILDELNLHIDELAQSSKASSSRMAEVVNNLAKGTSGSQLGPGIYLQRWETLMKESQLHRGMSLFDTCDGELSYRNIIMLIGPKFARYLETFSKD